MTMADPDSFSRWLASGGRGRDPHDHDFYYEGGWNYEPGDGSISITFKCAVDGCNTYRIEGGGPADIPLPKFYESWQEYRTRLSLRNCGG